MVKWDEFEPADFEYDFERDKLAAHGVTFEEAVETFFSDFAIRRTKAIVTGTNFTGAPSAAVLFRSSFS